MKFALAVSALALAAALGSGASAASLTINSVSGVWQNDLPDPAVTGEGTSSLRWGIPITLSGRSGYDFAGAAPPALTVPDGSSFSLGTFTHRNFPILGAALSSVDLVVTIDVAGRATPITSTFSFRHWETDNTPPCPGPTGNTRSGCSDKVTATLNSSLSDSFTIGRTIYTFDVVGFQVGGQTFTDFWTAENKSNSAELMGTFRATGSTAVPLPAAGWALLAGLGVLPVLRRKTVKA